MLDTAAGFRQAADTGRSGTVLLHQPGMSDGRQHGRQRGDADRRRRISLILSSVLRLCMYLLPTTEACVHMRG